MSQLFYESGRGDRLIDESCYPDEIVDFLCQEEHGACSLSRQRAELSCPIVLGGAARSLMSEGTIGTLDSEIPSV